MTSPTAAPTAPTAPTAAPAFDFADATLPAITRTTETSGPNPFADVLLQSKEQGKGKAVTVPADKVGEVLRYIRRAANDLNIGSRIVLVSAKDNSKLSVEVVGGTKTGEGKHARTVGGKTVPVREDGTQYRGNVKVLFQGQKRKARKTETTPAAIADGATPVNATPAE